VGHASAGPRYLQAAIVATAFVAVLEFAGGLAAHSLALLSDAAHVVMDVVALAIALAATVQSARPSNARQTFGFARMEILAAVANGGLLLAVTILIAIEAVRRFAHPAPSAGTLMSEVAALGFIVNIAVGVMLARSAHTNLNFRAALLHVFSDALGAFAVVVGGIAIVRTGAAWIDPALSLLVAAIIVIGVAGVLRDAAHVLLESAPAHAEIPKVRERIRSLEGVVDIHDLHVWTIGSGTHALAAHVLLADKRISEATAVLRAIDTAMREDFSISHVTVQFECDSCTDDDRIVCTQETRAVGTHRH